MNKTTLSRRKEQLFSPIFLVVLNLYTQRVWSHAALSSNVIGFSNQLTEQYNNTHFTQQLYKYYLGFNRSLRFIFVYT